MFFRRKGKLRKEFDEKLLVQFSHLKKEWLNDKSLLDKSFDPSDEVISESKLSEAKYFFLFKEAKQRKINLLK
ncbi:YaaL family protein [Niallia circulans]|uniref:YaaL family protein n=1 Tax=Niallia circulans TaxID=1397 RepID=UPI00397DD950